MSKRSGTDADRQFAAAEGLRVEDDLRIAGRTTRAQNREQAPVMEPLRIVRRQKIRVMVAVVKRLKRRRAGHGDFDGGTPGRPYEMKRRYGTSVRRPQAERSEELRWEPFHISWRTREPPAGASSIARSKRTVSPAFGR